MSMIKFIRRGSLVPQYHSLKREWFHTPPVEYGFYAFPRGYVSDTLLCGQFGYGNSAFQNGRIRKIRDEFGKPIVGVYDDFLYEVGYEHKWHSKWIKFFKTHNLRECQVFLVDVVSCNKESTYLKGLENGDAPTTQYYLVAENPPRVFEYTGLIWSHLEYFNIWRGDLSKNEEKIEKRKRVIDSNDIIKRSGSWILTDFKTYKRALKKYASLAHFEYLRTEMHSDKENLNPFSPWIGPFHYKKYFEVYIESIQSKKKAA